MLINREMKTNTWVGTADRGALSTIPTLGNFFERNRSKRRKRKEKKR